MVFTASPKQSALFGMLTIVLIGIIAYSVWYSYERHEKIVQAQVCDEQLTKPTVVSGPGGAPALLYSINGCATIVVPPSLWDVLRGHIAFENVPQRLKVNPYTVMDILLGRYTLAPADVGCEKSATTTDCSSRISQAAPTPSNAFPIGGIVADPNPQAPAPAGYLAFKDNQWGVTFVAPSDWTPRVLPEGDGTQSMTSPDFS